MDDKDKVNKRAAELKGLTDRAEHLEESYTTYNIQPIIDAAEATLELIKSKTAVLHWFRPEHTKEEHLEEMVERMRSITNIAKASRLLGYIQGVAAAMYGVKLEELEELIS